MYAERTGLNTLRKATHKFNARTFVEVSTLRMMEIWTMVTSQESVKGACLWALTMETVPLRTSPKNEFGELTRVLKLRIRLFPQDQKFTSSVAYIFAIYGPKWVQDIETLFGHAFGARGSRENEILPACAFQGLRSLAVNVCVTRFVFLIKLIRYSIRLKTSFKVCYTVQGRSRRQR